MTPTDCILCRSPDTALIETIDASGLIALYRARASVETARLFAGPNVGLFRCNECGLKFYFPQVVGDGTFYDQLQKYPGYYMTEKEEFVEAAKWISPGEKVLEVGCGSGSFSRFIGGTDYTGLEFSDQAIAQARAMGLNVVKEDLGVHAAAHPASYDVVCYFQVLEHVPQPGEFIRNSLLALKPGGKLILAVPSEDSFIRDASNFYLNMPPHHASRWTDNTLRYIAKINNLEVVHLFHEQLNDHHRKFYVKTKTFRGFNRLLGRRTKAVDLSIKSKVLYGAAALLAAPRAAVLQKEKLIGQSVLVVYRKKSEG